MLTDNPQRNNKLAFKESVRVITSLYEGPWHGKEEIVVEDTLSLTVAVSPRRGSRLGVNSDVFIGRSDVSLR